MRFLHHEGYVLHYRWQDVRTDQTFVFINSLGTDYRIWSAVADAVNDYGNVLLFDSRGHGLSDVVPGTDGVQDFAGDVLALLDALQITKCVVVGLSVGGMVAQVLADSAPERVERLVLCDTRHQIGTAQAWNDRIGAVRATGMEGISKDVMPRWFSDRFLKEETARVAGYKNMLERTPALGYIKTCEAIRDADLTEVAGRIAVPTLCVVGSEDTSTPVDAVRDLADLIDGSRFDVIDGSGHLPCVENPDALAGLILQFARE